MRATRARPRLRGTSLAPLRVVFWLDALGDATSLQEVVAQVDALARVAEQVDARLAHAGVGGLAGAVALCERLRTVFDGVSAADLERMLGTVAALQADLEDVARGLAAIRDLKARIERIRSDGERGPESGT